MKILPRLLLVAASVPGIAYAAEPRSPQGVIPESVLTEVQNAKSASRTEVVPIAANEKRKNKISNKLKDCENALEEAQTQQKVATKALAMAHAKVKSNATIVAKVKSLETEVQRLREAKSLAEKELKQAQQLVAAKSADTKASEVSKAPASSSSNHEAALAEIDKCLASASQKTKSLAAAIKSAQDEKALAQQRAKKTGAELIVIRQEMEMVTRELANMKKRDSDHRQNLKALESKLATVSKQATSETAKLSKTANDLAKWEARAQRAESDLNKTKETMQTAMRLAADTKAKNQEFQEKLTLSVVSLAQRDTKVAASEKALNQARGALAKHQDEIKTLKSQVVTQRERAEASGNKLKALEAERVTLENAKLATDKALAKVKSELVATKKQSDKAAELQKQLEGYKIELTAKAKEADQVKHQFQALTKVSKQAKDRLDATLLKREELHDNLTILRNEFAQYRNKNTNDQKRFAQEATNNLQASLVKKDRAWQQQLDKRQKQMDDVKQSLQAKEVALQDAYKREKAALAKVGTLEKSSAQGGKERQALQRALDDLRRDLATSEKQACKLREQLEELEVLAAGGVE